MNDIDLSQLNSTIRAELARRGMHQRALAQMLGLSQASVSARLSGGAEWLSLINISEPTRPY